MRGAKENQNEDTNEVVVNKVKSEMDFQISPGDIDRIHKIGVPSKGTNRPIIFKFVRYMNRRPKFTKKRRPKGKKYQLPNI